MAGARRPKTSVRCAPGGEPSDFSPFRKNPLVLIASFDLGEGMDPFVSTRIKMGETSDVYALVKADNRFFFAKKEIKVTIGGCGG